MWKHSKIGLLQQKHMQAPPPMSCFITVTVKKKMDVFMIDSTSVSEAFVQSLYQTLGAFFKPLKKYWRAPCGWRGL